MYKIKTKSCNDFDNSTYLYMAARKDFCAQLKIRRAVEEDNDDIVKILARKCPRLQELYGEFYISEIIGRRPKTDRQIIVADLHDQAVGVMCLNSEINYTMLQNTYEIDPFHGLKKATSLEKEKYKRSNKLLHTFGDPIMNGKWSPFEEIKEKNTYFVRDKVQTKGKQAKMSHSRVNFVSNTVVQSDEDYKQQHSEDFSERELLRNSNISLNITQSVVNMLEEEPFDYEIVNIDTGLLAVPEVLSYDFLEPNFENLGPQRSRTKDMEENIKRRSSVLKTKNAKKPTLQKYSGSANAFMIELYGFREDIDDRQGFHLLEAAFEIMRDYDYCIIRVPCKDKSFHLLQHFCFVPTKNKMSSEYALYISHRSSVLGKLRVRKAEIIDIPQVAQFLKSLDNKETLWTVENTILLKNKLQCYLLLSSTTLVGIGIIEQPELIDFIRAKFNLDSHHIHKYHTSEGFNCGFVALKAVLVYPVFEAHYRFFARELMRFSGSHALLWLTACRSKWLTHKANSLVGSMVPLMPRNSEIDYSCLNGLRKIRNLSHTVISFSTWFLSKKLTSVPQINVDTRLVIVGASRTAMAFLNALLFSDSCTYLLFTNVTLISPHGLPYNKQSRPLSEMMFQKHHINSEKFLKSVPYTYYVNIINATMVDINKQEKYISLSNKEKCPYDMLFLFIGKQFQHPNYKKSVFKNNYEAQNEMASQYISLDVPRNVAKPEVNCTPSNVFTVNTFADANRALNFVNGLKELDMDYKILVYGGSVNAYCCLATLIKTRIPVENIAFIEPFPLENSKKPRVSCFSNVYIDKSVSEVLKNLNIKVYRSYYFQNWITDGNNLVTHVDFLSHHHFIRLQCSALFYYGFRGVNEQAFFALHKSDMAYDGGILIDHEFKTKDDYIYAAGPATRYYRKYQADDKRQKYYDTCEVGSKLGCQIRNKLDPLFTELKELPKYCAKSSIKTVSFDSSMKLKGNNGDQASIDGRSSRDSKYLNVTPDVPNFKQPIVIYYTLPGGLQYLEVRSPGKKTPHHFVQSLQYNGFVMETFKEGYFKLHFTNDLILDGVTCLTTQTYSLENFTKLYGFSATVLNNVYLRYTTKKIDNFYDFFRASWAYFIYHDQSEELFAMAKELLPKGQQYGSTLAEALRNVGEKISNPTKLKIQSNFERSKHIEAITDYVIEWLSEHDVSLAMYLQPWQVTQYGHDVIFCTAVGKKKNSITKLLSKIF